MKRYRTGLLLMILIVLIFYAFSPALKCNFINWDDDRYVTSNKILRSLSPENLRNIFVLTDREVYKKYPYSKGLYIPVTLISFAIEYHFFHLNSTVYHFTNIMLHILNCLLVFWFVFLISSNINVSFLTAVFFGIHPIHVESIAWISERKDLLFGFFLLVSIVSYILYVKSKKGFYFISLLTFTLSLSSKPTAIFMPFSLFFLDLILPARERLRSYLDKIPFFIISFVFIFINIIAARLLGETGHRIDEGSLNPLLNFTIPFYSLLFYIKKMLLPVNLSCFYPFPPDQDISTPPVFILSVIVVSLIVTVFFMLSRMSKKTAFSGMFFLLMLFPVLQIFVKFNVVAADRYTYIPSIPFFYLIFEFLFPKDRENSSRYRQLIIVMFSAIVIIVAVLTFLTMSRCRVWKDDITLWSDVLKNHPDVLVAYNNRGYLYAERGDYKRAFEDYNNAIRRHPGYASAFINRSTLYIDQGLYDDAISDVNRAIMIRPNMEVAYINRAKAFIMKKEYYKAIEDLNKAMELNPYNYVSYLNRGIAYFMTGNYNKSTVDLTEEIRQNPENAEGYFYRGTIYSIRNNYDKALIDLNRTIRINSRYVDAYYNRGLIFLMLKKYPDAIRDLTTLLVLKNDYMMAYLYRGRAYYEMKSYSEAIKDYSSVIGFNPIIVEAYLKRGQAYYFIGKYPEAIRDLSKAIKIDPGSKESYEYRSMVYLRTNKLTEAHDDKNKASRINSKSR